MTYLIEPDTLEARLGEADLAIIDLGRASTYQQLHIPGAVHLDYRGLVLGMPPAAGLPPPASQLQRVLSAAGISPRSTVVAYDDEGGGNASRLLWTLAGLGHENFHLLNGGLHAWAQENHPTTQEVTEAQSGDYPIGDLGYAQANADDVHAALSREETVLLDCRSAAEFHGVKRFSARAGHIPGAVHMDWLEAIDKQRNMRFVADELLVNKLAELGVTPEREVIVYCQTHHRSSHTFMVLKHLGFERVRGYAGAWAEWGNRPDLPVEI